MAIQDRSLAVGTRLVAKYKGTEHTVEVAAGKEGKRRYRLTDGREFASPSAAGKAVIGGTACNGWRFWSVAGAAPTAGAAPPTTPPVSRDAAQSAGSGPTGPTSGQRADTGRTAPKSGKPAPKKNGSAKAAKH